MGMAQVHSWRSTEEIATITDRERLEAEAISILWVSRFVRINLEARDVTFRSLFNFFFSSNKPKLHTVLTFRKNPRRAYGQVELVVSWSGATGSHWTGPLGRPAGGI